MDKDLPKTCVAPSGVFTYGIHKPDFTSVNLRPNSYIVTLGETLNHQAVRNEENFPENNVRVARGSWVFEIPNAFPFMGTTYIVRSTAERMTGHAMTFQEKGHDLQQGLSNGGPDALKELAIEQLPRPLLLALAGTTTDPQTLARIARLSCRFVSHSKTQPPSGMIYEKTESGSLRPVLLDPHLFDIVSNNPSLPDEYKRQMVLIPGVQGNSPIVGEYRHGDVHVLEYLRENSYIPWGHYAANMAHDAIRYKIASLSEQDIIGLRHLYYQRVYAQLAKDLGQPVPAERRCLTGSELEDLRLALVRKIEDMVEAGRLLPFNATIWGQNFGFDRSPSGYRLNASHQQTHQQYALVPCEIPGFQAPQNESADGALGTYVQGDLIAEFVKEYRGKTNKEFFETYLAAIGGNQRLDGRVDREKDLVFFEDDHVLAFVPKAQRSRGEVQIMTKVRCGNIMEADSKTRSSLDCTILLAMKVLANLGADMITAFEISKRFDNPDRDQRLLYCFLPKHPESPGGFSEWQQRWLIGHYPEDFAQACRRARDKIMQEMD